MTYDSNGYLASQTDWNGNLTNQVNDSRGRTTSIVEAAGTPLARTKTITYHPTLRLPVRIVEPGVTTNFTYDSAGNLLTRTRTDTTTTTERSAHRVNQCGGPNDSDLAASTGWFAANYRGPERSVDQPHL